MHPGGGELNSIGIEMLCNCCAHAQILFKLDWTDTCTSEDRHTLVAIAELCFTHRSKNVVKTADLQAHNASLHEALCACRSAVFTTFVRWPCMMKQ